VALKRSFRPFHRPLIMRTSLLAMLERMVRLLQYNRQDS
jgi:hypothetical protein